MKLILKPTASGISARIAANAVSNTGMIRVLPACTTASLVFIPLALSSSANSITRIPFFTTMPARPTIPIPVITTDTCIPVMAKPSNTPITLKIISVNIITGLLTELNCNTSINRISINAISNALPRKAPVSACCSPSPVCLMLTPSGLPLNVAITFVSSAFTAVGVKPCVSSTFERSVMTRF